MVELRLVDVNPVEMAERLSEKSGERQVYLSFKDVAMIAERCPAWFRSIIWTGYYSGMRRAEILGLNRNQVKLEKRMLYLGPKDTNELHWTRIPVHKKIVPILEQALKVSVLGSDRVFLLHDRNGVPPLGEETVKNQWPRACEVLQIERPWPRLHDFRHAWRSNARRSGMDPHIAEAILGHWYKARSINDRYGSISDEELIQAIDTMTFDNGDTEISVSRS